nr:MAG TPA: hypothetical protein [Caudoviricetes sp.]DAY40716.1 MAG TPA: hypothetical protein [Caudoviricetes sp.]
MKSNPPPSMIEQGPIEPSPLTKNIRIEILTF